MACTGAYAAAWQYAAFWCTAGLLTGTHTGGMNAGTLTDSLATFVQDGVKAGYGMVMYNLTDGSSGPVTAVTDTTITATLTGGSGNDWDTGDSYRIVPITAKEIAQINHYLTIAANDVHIALAATDACNCTLSSWGSDYLGKINMIDALVFHRCPCSKPSLTLDEQRMYMDFVTAQLELLRTGKQDVCNGATGADFPAIDWAEHGTTDFAKAQIIVNDSLRNP